MLKKYYEIIQRLFFILINNPKFFFKRIFLELRASVLPVPKHPVFKKINGVSFKLDFDYSPKIKEMYFDVYQPVISEILRAHLKNGDTFIDVGANIGFFSAIAAGCVGKNGRVYSFEPVPEYFQKLENFATINRQYKITVNQFALGDEEKTEKIYIRGHSYIGHNTFFLDSLNGAKEVTTKQVPIRRLDKYIKEKNINNIKLIKIDVEGFEFPVLKGLSDYFSECRNKKQFPIIVCEICPDACLHFGYKLQDIFAYMKSFSYYPFEVVNAKKRVSIDKIMKNGQEVDVLFRNI